MSTRQFNNLKVLFSRAATDPQSWALLRELPNPDPILRKAGKTSEIYHSISRDAHVIGELRTMRAGLTSLSNRTGARWRRSGIARQLSNGEKAV